MPSAKDASSELPCLEPVLDNERLLLRWSWRTCLLILRGGEFDNAAWLRTSKLRCSFYYCGVLALGYVSYCCSHGCVPFFQFVPKTRQPPDIINQLSFPLIRSQALSASEKTRRPQPPDITPLFYASRPHLYAPTRRYLVTGAGTGH